MSGFYGVNYKINGHRVGVVHALAGEYRVIFERCYEENTLEAVETIDWQNVTVEQVRTNYPACPLPEGYCLFDWWVILYFWGSYYGFLCSNINLCWKAIFSDF